MRTNPAAWRQSWQACQELPSLRRGGVVPVFQFAFAGVAGIAMLNCATSAELPPRAASSEVAGASAYASGAPLYDPNAAETRRDGKPGQWLIRAEISGDNGSASLRLLLHRFKADRFSLSAADALGQARWEIRRAGEEAIWLDPQERIYCQLDARRPLRARLWVPAIAIADLPALLTEEWPPESAVAKGSPPPDSLEQQFTGERREGRWETWTLWEGGAPTAWFKRLGSDSLLSLRRPSVQVRWRVTAQGDLASLPNGAAEGEIDFSSDESYLWPGGLRTGLQEIACPENEIP